jgi:hypothetical protein
MRAINRVRLHERPGVALVTLYLWWEKRSVEPPDVPMEALVPLQRFDGLLLKEMDSSLGSLDAPSARRSC